MALGCAANRPALRAIGDGRIPLLADWLASHDWARETLRSYRSALRSFYGWGRATGEIDSDPSRLLRKVPATIGIPRPAPERVISDALSASPARVWLMLMLGSRHGLRRGEISLVSTRDLRSDPDGWSLIVHGKGAKDRVVPLLDDVARVIRDSPTLAWPSNSCTARMSPVAW